MWAICWRAVHLLTAGMLASSLTNSSTVAFVLGVVFCCVPVMLYYVTDVVEWIYGLFGKGLNSMTFEIAWRR
jgi:DMSO reductase anchor subunit